MGCIEKGEGVGCLMFIGEAVGWWERLGCMGGLCLFFVSPFCLLLLLFFFLRRVYTCHVTVYGRFVGWIGRPGWG